MKVQNEEDSDTVLSEGEYLNSESSESNHEKTKRLKELTTQLETSSAQRCALWFVPYGFGCAIAVCGLTMFLSQSQVLCVALRQLNGIFLLSGFASFLIVDKYYDYRIKALARKFFRQKKKEHEPDFLLPSGARVESLQRWTRLDYDWIHEGEGANVQPGLGRFLVSWFVFCFYCMVFSMFIFNVPEQNLSSYLWKDLLKAFVLVGATYFKRMLQIRAFNDLKETCHYVVQNSNIHYILKMNEPAKLPKK